MLQDLPTDKTDQNELISPMQIASEDEEDLTEFKFQKFAATYFQGNITHQYSRKPLKHPLLPLHTQGDQLVRELMHNLWTYMCVCMCGREENTETKYTGSSNNTLNTGGPLLLDSHTF